MVSFLLSAVSQVAAKLATPFAFPSLNFLQTLRFEIVDVFRKPDLASINAS
jgi:hypothetical protein